MESEDPVIQNSGKLPILALEGTASKHYVITAWRLVHMQRARSYCRRQTAVTQGRICISMGMGNIFCLLFFFFVIKVHVIYSTIQNKLSKGD